jgi:hypothetical protein
MRFHVTWGNCPSTEQRDGSLSPIPGGTWRLSLPTSGSWGADAGQHVPFYEAIKNISELKAFNTMVMNTRCSETVGDYLQSTLDGMGDTASGETSTHIPCRPTRAMNKPLRLNRIDVTSKSGASCGMSTYPWRIGTEKPKTTFHQAWLLKNRIEIHRSTWKSHDFPFLNKTCKNQSQWLWKYHRVV